MPLSTGKLERLLALKGFIPTRYFVMHNIIAYIEIVSITEATMFLLYIPSKYKFIVSKNTDNVYKIKYIDIDESNNNTANDYAGEPDAHMIENTYQEIDAQISPTVDGDNIEKHLEDNYRREIALKDISSDDSKELKDIFRQLKRLRFCVQNVKYKIAIIYKNYICSIKHDDSIEYYSIKKYRGKPYKQLLISCDLELFYEKMDSLMLNINTIRSGIYHILDKNHITHSRTLQKLLEEKNTIMDFSENAYTKKREYEKYINETTDMLDAINKSEKHIMDQIHEINQRYNKSSGLQNDIEKSHQLTKLKDELSDVQKIKEDLVKTIFNLTTKREDTMLTIDKIMFDNNVMIDCVLRNFRNLGDICRKK